MSKSIERHYLVDCSCDHQFLRNQNVDSYEEVVYNLLELSVSLRSYEAKPIQQFYRKCERLALYSSGSHDLNV